MKKTTSAPDTTGTNRNANQEMFRSVVTQLQANRPSAREPAAPRSPEPDIDLDELRAAIDDLPELNATKLVALHRRIVNGDYRIDSDRLAEKLIELESALDRD